MALNLANTATISAKTAMQAVTTSATAMVSNASNSGKIHKINTIIVSNIDASNSAEITIDVYRNTTAIRIVNSVIVPIKASFTALDKDNIIYLEEGDSIRVTANAASRLEAICSYEELS